MSYRAAAIRAALLGLVLLALHPLLCGRLLLGHDAEYYPPRLVEFARAVREGHLPPVWAPDLSCGHGQPAFVFVPPALYALGTPLLAAGLPLPRAVQLPVLAAVAAGALATFALGRRLGGEPGGLLATTMFLFAPYLQVDLWVRSAYAESVVLAFVPVALLRLVQLAAGVAGLAPCPWLALLVALLAATHPPGSLLGLFVLGLFTLALLPASRGRLLPAAAGSILLGLGLAAVSWLPALAERDLVKTSLLAGGRLRYADHFVTWRQLLWSDWGFGHSLPGPGDGMPFYVGPAHLVLGAAGAVAAVRSRERLAVAVGLASLAGAASGALLSTRLAAALWETIPLLPYFGYPWRTLALPAILLPVLAAFAGKHLRLAGTAAAVLLVVVLNVRHVGPWGSRGVASEEAMPERVAETCARSSLYEEFEPATAVAGLAYQREPLESLGAPIRILQENRGAAAETYRVEAKVATRLAARTFAYPGWSVRIDGQPVPSAPERATGRLAFEVPAGAHDVAIRLERTPAQRLGMALTLASAAILSALLLFRYRPARPSPGAPRSAVAGGGPAAHARRVTPGTRVPGRRDEVLRDA